MAATDASWKRHGGHPVPGPAGDGARLLIAGDTHGNLDWLGTIARLASRLGCDGVVQLGDFGFWPDQRRLRSDGERVINDRWLDAVTDRFAHHGVWLRVLDGNHDAIPLAAAVYPPDPATGIAPVRDRVLDWATRGAHWEWLGLRFGALGGAVSIDREWRQPGTNWWREEEITDEQVDLLASRGELDVLFSHDAPAGMQIPGIGPLPGDLGRDAERSRYRIRNAVEATSPKLLMHGHYHIRHSATLERPNGKLVRGEGLASDEQAGRGGALVVLELPTLTVIDVR